VDKTGIVNLGSLIKWYDYNLQHKIINFKGELK